MIKISKLAPKTPSFDNEEIPSVKSYGKLCKIKQETLYSSLPDYLMVKLWFQLAVLLYSALPAKLLLM